MKKGVFCISIDTELLWGRKDLDYSKFVSKTKKERIIIKKILKLFDKYNIPSTWAIVGKLSEGKDQLWSGKDIIREIKKHKNQEIGSHSYTHPEFTKLNSSEADYEIRNSKAKSFVFPRNKIKYLYLLKKYKFVTYRGMDKSFQELLIPRIPPVYTPSKTSGLLNIPGSMYFPSARSLKKYIPKNLRFFKSKLGIDSAIKHHKVFHIWFHPVDFADRTEELLQEFEKILKYANQKRNDGKLEIKNMEQIAK
jgi:hypothetical protein